MGGMSVFSMIKKQNGEAFAQSIRRYDNGIFDVENLPEIVRHAGRNAEPLLPFLESLKKVEVKDVETDKDPFELLKEAGYDAFYADSEEKQNAIASYYPENEGLCTFLDKSRYLSSYIIHAVKEGADQLKRTDFKNPLREDEYGASVLSIQILKEGGFIKIVSRYNHGVQNSDNTFNSNPDNIIRGLSSALKRYFKVDFSSREKDLPAGYKYLDGQIFKIHEEKKHVYFGDGFYIQNEVVHLLDKDFNLVIDDFIIDLKEKCVKTPLAVADEKQAEQTRYTDTELTNLALLINDEIEGKTLRILKCKDEKSLYADGRLILKEKNNCLTHLYLPTTTRPAVNFLCFHKTIEVAEVNKVSRFLGSSFYHCPNLRVAKAFVLKEVNDTFVAECPNLFEADFPSLEKMGRNSFIKLLSIEKLIFFSLKEVGSNCLNELNALMLLSAGQLKRIGNNSVKKLFKMKTLDLSGVEECGNGSLSGFPLLKEMFVSALKKTADYCLRDMPLLKLIEANALRQTGDFCLSDLGVKELSLDALEEVGHDNLQKNTHLKYASFKSLRKTGFGFMAYCPLLIRAEVENLKKLERDSFKKDEALSVIKADELNEVSKYAELRFLYALNCLYAPKLNEALMFALFYLHPNQDVISQNKNSKECVKKVFLNKRERTNG